MTKSSGEKQPARLSAELPENYSRESKFPLFIFLTGGGGGRGEATPSARELVGARDFICVNLPQFKRHLDTNEPFRGLSISPEDLETVSRAYRTMLQRLFDTVPNITSKRSTLGGFSNGANTTAVLLAGQDDFILQHFDSTLLPWSCAAPAMHYRRSTRFFSANGREIRRYRHFKRNRLWTAMTRPNETKRSTE